MILRMFLNVFRSVKRFVFTFEFAFMSFITLVGVITMLSIVNKTEQSESFPQIARKAYQALTIGEKNTDRLNALEQRVEEQQEEIQKKPSTIVVERRIHEASKPFNDPRIRDRARQLRNNQQSAEKNR